MEKANVNSTLDTVGVRVLRADDERDHVAAVRVGVRDAGG